jgi:hypothetical protein
VLRSLINSACIFKVKKVDDTDDTIYVLKDLWLEKDRKPEHQIYEDIISDVGCLYPQKDLDTVKQHLLTPVNNMFVEVNGIREDTETSMMQSHTLESVRQPILIPSRGRPRSGATHPRSSEREVEPVHGSDKIHHRWHYRVVFKEYAKPIYQVEMMADVFTVLADLIEGQSFDLVMANTFSSFYCSVSIPSWKWMGASRHQCWQCVPLQRTWCAGGFGIC